jgi:hypothetical protein
VYPEWISSPTSYVPKFTLEQAFPYPHQRSGWQYAQASVRPLLRADGAGVLLDTMIERNFGRTYTTAAAEGRIPYRRPWVGIVHVPADFPPWFDGTKSFHNIIQTPAWRESWPLCRGLFTLSQSMRCWLANRVDVSVAALRHPTEIPSIRFDWDQYEQQGQRVVQVGWWLRNLSAIYFLDIPSPRKALLIPQSGEGLARFENVFAADRKHHGAPAVADWGLTVLPRMDDEHYDYLLASSLVFLNLAGSVANNAIIECIVRATPVLVNSLPSVREYLGEEYPLYYQDMEEAAAKASDPSLVYAAHRYLKSLDLSFLSGETFCRELAESAIYQSLPGDH